MTKPRRVSALSSVLKETQQYNKVAQEDEQVISSPVEQETINTEKQISVDTDKHVAVRTETQKAVSATTQKSVTTEQSERTHKQTIVISEDLALRLKIHAAKRKETIASIATRAFEKLLAEEEDN